MSCYPDDCGINSIYDLPWQEPEQTECSACGSGMSISSFDKDILICDNSEHCNTTIDLSDSGLNGDW